MTKDDLKAWAQGLHAGNADVAAAVLRLLAQEEARGEVFAACPHCDRWEIRQSQTKPDHQICTQCHAMFTEPAYYQRIPAPTGQD